MKRGFWLAALAAAFSTQATAMEAEQAREFLQGTWVAAAETWIFADDEWQQFNRGVMLKTTFEVEALPADMFIVVSAETGRRYVVHTSPQFNSMSWYAEGTSEQIGYYTRRAD